MEKRNLKLQKYGISKAKYLELKYFCMQYNDYLESIQYGMKNSGQDAGMPKGSISTSSPVEKQAIDNVKAIDAVNTIDSAIAAVADDEQMRNCIRQAVTLGTAYEYMKVPCGRRQFYELRREFFYILSKKR